MTARGRGRVWREGGTRGGVWRENGGAFGGRSGAARCCWALGLGGGGGGRGGFENRPVVHGLGWLRDRGGLYGKLGMLMMHIEL